MQDHHDAHLFTCRYLPHVHAFPGILLDAPWMVDGPATNVPTSQRDHEAANNIDKNNSGDEKNVER